MLKFWGFEVKCDQDGHVVSIKSNKGTNNFNNHNALRVTRVLHSLKIFSRSSNDSLAHLHKLFLNELLNFFGSCNQRSIQESLKYFKKTQDTMSIFEK